MGLGRQYATRILTVLVQLFLRLTLTVLAGVAVDALAAVLAHRRSCAGRRADSAILTWLAAAERIWKKIRIQANSYYCTQ